MREDEIDYLADQQMKKLDNEMKEKEKNNKKKLDGVYSKLKKDLTFQMQCDANAAMSLKNEDI